MTPTSIKGNQLTEDKMTMTWEVYLYQSDSDSDCDNCDFDDDGIRVIPVQGSEVQGLSRLPTSG